jgi:uncharacterized membrane protein YtjA (UPF0391 family)
MGITGAEAGITKPIVVVAAMLFILILFFGAVGVFFR